MLSHQNRVGFSVVLRALAVLIAILATACAAKDSSTAQASLSSRGPVDANLIGPEGGIIQSGGATLIIPAGALATRTRITLTRLNKPSAEVLGSTPLGAGYEAGPEGQTFLKPVEIILPFDPTLVPANADANKAQIKMAPHGSTSFVALDSRVDFAARLIHTFTVHFTQFVPAQDPNPVFITDSSSTLPDALHDDPYSHQFAAVGGSDTHTFAIPPGNSLPSGLSLSASGLLSGTPTSLGTSSFFISASDTLGHTVQRTFALTVDLASTPAPTLYSIAPSSGHVGDSNTTIQLTGDGFVPTSQATLNGANIATTFVNVGTLSATVPASALAAEGDNLVGVTNPAPGGGDSARAHFTVLPGVGPSNPEPTLYTISPNTGLAGTDAIITLNGDGFVATSQAEVSGTAIVTAFVNSGSLTATIPASLVAAGGDYLVDVVNPAPGGGISARAHFTVTGGGGGTSNPEPTLYSITPATSVVGSADTTITLNGDGFVATSQATFGGSSITTTLVDSGTLTAVIPAASLAAAGDYLVGVVNPTPGGGTSAHAHFIVTAVVSNPAPTLTSITPSSATAGSAVVTITLMGGSFVAGGQAFFGATALSTTITDSSNATAAIPAALMTSTTSANVTLVNPTPGGGASNAIVFTVNPAPTARVRLASAVSSK